jgi:hypothetical protein
MIAKRSNKNRKRNESIILENFKKEGSRIEEINMR